MILESYSKCQQCPLEGQQIVNICKYKRDFKFRIASECVVRTLCSSDCGSVGTDQLVQVVLDPW